MIFTIYITILSLLLYLNNIESQFYLTPYPHRSDLIVYVGFKCYSRPGQEGQKIPTTFKRFKALVSLQSKTSWTFTPITKFEMVPAKSTHTAEEILEDGLGIPRCFLRVHDKAFAYEGGLEAAKHKFPEQTFVQRTFLPELLSYQTKVKFFNRSDYQRLYTDEYGQKTDFCTIFGQVLEYTIKYNGRISDLLPLQFNAVLGFASDPDNELIKSLQMLNIPTMLAINVRESNELPEIAVGQKIRYMPIDRLDFIEMPVMDGPHGSNWGIKNVEVQADYPYYYLGKLKKYLTPLIRKSNDDFVIIETANEYVTVPRKFFGNLKGKIKWFTSYKRIKKLYQFLRGDIKTLPCYIARSIMPSFTFTFTNEAGGKVKVFILGSYLLRALNGGYEREANDKLECVHLLRYHDSDEPVWYLGLAFLRRVYVELHYDEYLTDHDIDEKVSYVKMYPKLSYS